MMELVRLHLGADSYPIYIGEGLIDDGVLFRSLIRGNEVLIVTDETVAPLYLDRIRVSLGGKRLDSLALADGETTKSLETLNLIFTHLLARGHKRSSTIVALGGGVVGDTAGFAAACYQRGIDYIQVPTTLLAQVDSSVGGKTAVNHPLGKNMIGAFHQPRGVVIDIATLRTLSSREFSAGMAEVIKHGALDRDYFDFLEAHIDDIMSRDAAILIRVIKGSCEIKAGIVSADEHETGDRALLNLGHTFGHAIEAAMGYGDWLHGEAVAVGMVMAADLSVRAGLCPAVDGERLKALLERAGLPTAPPREMASRFMEFMARDKKATEAGLRLILLKGIGGAVIVDDVSIRLLEQTISAGANLLVASGG
jgi:3-dehydroquinate synthase